MQTMCMGPLFDHGNQIGGQKETMADREPKYLKVIEWVKDNIATGKFKYGDRMMSEKELSEKFGLSRQTIRHATGELVNQHLVTRVQGSGTYIGSSYMPVREEQYMSVAVVSTFYESYIFPPTLKGIESVLSAENYSMQVSFTDNRVSREEEILKNILAKDSIDGLIVEPAKSALPNPNLRYYREIRNRHIPIIFFNAEYPGLDAPCVRFDDVEMGRRAASVLIQNGHRKIAGIFKADDGQGRLRYEGYYRAVHDAGLETDQENVIWIDTPEILNLDAIGAYLLQRIDDCTGVVCYNDEAAYQMVEIAAKHGMKVPEDLSVIGIDDANVASICRVPLTTFPHPKEELGRKVASNLLNMIKNPEFDGNFRFVTDPVYRKSVCDLTKRS